MWKKKVKDRGKGKEASVFAQMLWEADFEMWLTIWWSYWGNATMMRWVKGSQNRLGSHKAMMQVSPQVKEKEKEG